MIFTLSPQKKFYILFPTDSLKEENAYLVRVSGSESSMHVEATAVNPYVLCVCPPKGICPVHTLCGTNFITGTVGA